MRRQTALLSALLAAPLVLTPASAIRCANCTGEDGTPSPSTSPGHVCLAAGTVVTTASGAALAVERVRLGQPLLALEQPSLEWASSAPGRPTFRAGAVTAVYSALNTRPMYRLSDSAGHVLTATDHHPVFTLNRGNVQMARLRVGDVLLTTGGRATVSGLSRVNSPGKVFNFVVNLGNNPGNQGRGAAHTFFANGILVGDMDVQDALAMRGR